MGMGFCLGSGLEFGLACGREFRFGLVKSSECAPWVVVACLWRRWGGRGVVPGASSSQILGGRGKQTSHPPLPAPSERRKRSLAHRGGLCEGGRSRG